MFSSAKLTDMDIALGPEMKSTGEVLGIDKDLDKAMYKGFLGAGMAYRRRKCVCDAQRSPSRTIILPTSWRITQRRDSALCDR